MTFFSQAILRTLAYNDVFNFPLTEREISQFLVSEKQVSLGRVKKETKFLVKKKLIAFKNGFYFLKSRQPVVTNRKNRRRWSNLKVQIAQRTATYLRIIPWIQAVLLTGGVAKENANQGDDIDFLIITASRRLWLSRLFSVFLLGILGRRRRPHQKVVKDKICLNIFWSADNLTLPKKDQNLFSANEIIRARLLWQKSDVYFRFIVANAWIRKYLANAYALKVPSSFRRRVELRSSEMLNWLENCAFKFQLAYMKPKMTCERVGFNQAFFHPHQAPKWVLAEYQKRLANLGIA